MNADHVSWSQSAQRLAYRVTRAEPGELGRAAWLFLYNFLVITAYLIVKPVRNSLFLDRLGAENLPYAYIGTALFVGIVTWAYSRALDRLPRERVGLVTWSFLGLGLIGFWFGFQRPGVLVSAFFYFFSAAFAVLGVTQFWSFTAEVLDPRQGRRLYGFIQAGAILGGLAGGVLTHFLAPVLGTEQLLFVSAAICFLCGGIASNLASSWERVELPRAKQEAPEESTGLQAALGGAGLVMASRYLMLVASMMFCFQLVSTLVDYQFNSAVAAGIAEKNARTAFYGSFFFFLNSASFLFQTFMTTRILRTRGLSTALVLLPGVAALGSGAFFLVPVFWVACGLRWAFGTLDYSLDRATRELLYLPTSTPVKTKAKAFLDMFCFRFFRCIAGILILALGSFGGDVMRPLSLAILAVAGLWLVVAGALTREYVSRVRVALFGHADPAEAPPQVAVDLVDVGYETRRLAAALAAGRDDTPHRQRLGQLASSLYGPTDVPAALEALADPQNRPLAQELLDGVTPPGPARLLVRILDPTRPTEVRLRLAEKLDRALGVLPEREKPREAWVEDACDMAGEAVPA